MLVLWLLRGGQRADNISKFGLNILTDKKPQSRPLGFWTEKDIWAYADQHNIRFAECYYDRIIDGVFLPAEKRTGCIGCGNGYQFEKNTLFECDRYVRQKIKNPARYNKLMALTNNGVTFETVLKKISNA